mgnify:FL=1
MPAPPRPEPTAGTLTIAAHSMRRVDARSATLRNRYILDHADRLVLGTRDPAGSLKGLTATLAFI